VWNSRINAQAAGLTAALGSVRTSPQRSGDRPKTDHSHNANQGLLVVHWHGDNPLAIPVVGNNERGKADRTPGNNRGLPVTWLPGCLGQLTGRGSQDFGHARGGPVNSDNGSDIDSVWASDSDSVIGALGVLGRAQACTVLPQCRTGRCES
jgi:hypothetical protein